MQEEQPQQPIDPEKAGAATPPRETRSRVMQPRPSLTAKELRIGERLIELGIFSISTLSIIFIFLIFFFVFREASPIFFGSSEEADTVVTATVPAGAVSTIDTSDPGSSAVNDTSSDESDVYNPDAKDIPTEIAQTTPTSPKPDDSGTDSDASDVYNPDAKDIPNQTDSVPLSGSTTESPAPPAPQVPTKAESDARAREIVGEGYPILEREDPVKPGYLLHDNWQPNSDHPRYGIYPIVVGTLKTTLIALLLAAPMAILAAIYTAFFAPKWIREKLKPAIEVLAGFPSVVLGFFCLMTVGTIVQEVFGTEFRLNSFVGGIGLALAVIPIIYTLSDDALRAVPGSLREAALALGASEWQTAYRVMLPAATPGIFAAILLGIGRAFGETMIALMATGNASIMSWNFFDPVRTFAATIGAEMGEVVFGGSHYQVLFLLGVILFVFSFLINLVTEFYVKQRLIKRFRGAE